MQHELTKIQLSKEESVLVNDAQILLTKNRIIQKVYELFGQLALQYQFEIGDVLPEEINKTNPKISKGENYLGLPYVMLDYPRIFLKEDTLAIRTFFWWGNFFSITVQLSGKYHTMFLPKFLCAAEQHLLKDWYISINENKWQHHFGENNYTQFSGNEVFKLMNSAQDLKLAIKIPLTEWDNAFDFFIGQFKFLINVMKA